MWVDAVSKRRCGRLRTEWPGQRINLRHARGGIASSSVCGAQTCVQLFPCSIEWGVVVTRVARSVEWHAAMSSVVFTMRNLVVLAVACDTWICVRLYAVRGCVRYDSVCSTQLYATRSCVRRAAVGTWLWAPGCEWAAFCSTMFVMSYCSVSRGVTSRGVRCSVPCKGGQLIHITYMGCGRYALSPWIVPMGASAMCLIIKTQVTSYWFYDSPVKDKSFVQILKQNAYSVSPENIETETDYAFCSRQ